MTSLPSRFDLAASPWPRTGGDRRNSGASMLAGPLHGRIVGDVVLPAPAEGGWRGGGIAVASDGSVIVAVDGRVTRLALEGRIASVATIPPPAPDPNAEAEDDAVDEDHATDGSELDEPAPPVRRYIAPPVALADGTTLVLSPPEVLVFDAAGALVAREHVGMHADDSALSPNVAHDGALLLTYMTGEVERFADGARVPVGRFGYDIVPPAVCADDALVIAGYAGAGLVCIAPDRSVRWRAPLRKADMLPAIDRDGFVAAGSMNEKRSVVVSPEGEVVGTIPSAAAFAVGPVAEGRSGDWLARSRDTTMRVRRDGTCMWSVVEVPAPDLAWGAQAPIVDAAGQAYVLGPDALIIRDLRDGAERARVRLPGPPRALAIVAHGQAALLVRDRLVLVE